MVTVGLAGIITLMAMTDHEKLICMLIMPQRMLVYTKGKIINNSAYYQCRIVCITSASEEFCILIRNILFSIYSYSPNPLTT